MNSSLLFNYYNFIYIIRIIYNNNYFIILLFLVSWCILLNDEQKHSYI